MSGSKTGIEGSESYIMNVTINRGQSYTSIKPHTSRGQD